VRGRNSSTREIARITGWDFSTIARDLQKDRVANATESVANATRPSLTGSAETKAHRPANFAAPNHFKSWQLPRFAACNAHALRTHQARQRRAQETSMKWALVRAKERKRRSQAIARNERSN
jgi:hypothetical protein